jgi:hypothetical protein
MSTTHFLSTFIFTYSMFCKNISQRKKVVFLTYFLNFFVEVRLKIPPGKCMKKIEILSFYTILHTQTYQQSFQTDLKTSQCNWLEFEKANIEGKKPLTFYGGYCMYVHTRTGLLLPRYRILGASTNVPRQNIPLQNDPIQNVPAPKHSKPQNIPTSKYPKPQNAQASRRPNQKTSELQNVLASKHPKPQNVPTPKYPKPQNVLNLTTSQLSHN